VAQTPPAFVGPLVPGLRNRTPRRRRGSNCWFRRRVKSIQMRVGPKGAKNVMRRVLKHAILRAAAKSRHAKDNGGGLEGYLVHIADERPDLFVRLLAKLVPMQEKELAKTKKEPDRPVEPVVYKTVAEVRAALIARGMPIWRVDQIMDALTSNVIDGPFKRQDRDDTDDDVA
jgi:hypothetical protein